MFHLEAFLDQWVGKNLITSNGTVGLSTMPKWTGTCRSTILANSIILPLTYTELSHADWEDLLYMGRMTSRHFSEMNNEQIWSGPAPVSMTLTDGQNMFDIIPTNMDTLQFVLNNTITLIMSMASSSAFLSQQISQLQIHVRLSP